MKRKNRGSSSTTEQQAVKVVIIDTQYVETDASSFKSVVQQLTGKDATAGSQARFCADKLASRSSASGVLLRDVGAGAGTCCAVESFLSRGLSFKHFDGLSLMDLDQLFGPNSVPVWYVDR